MAKKKVSQVPPGPVPEETLAITRQQFRDLHDISISLGGLSSILISHQTDGITEIGSILKPMDNQLADILDAIEQRPFGTYSGRPKKGGAQ